MDLDFEACLRLFKAWLHLFAAWLRLFVAWLRPPSQVDDIVQFLEHPGVTARIGALCLLMRWHVPERLDWAKVIPRLADPNWIVRCKAGRLLAEEMPSEVIPECWAAMLNSMMKHEDPRARFSPQELLEKRLSTNVLAAHFGKIVPSLLTEPKLQSWSFDFLRSRMSAEQLVEHIDVVISHLTSQDEPARKRTFEFIEEQMPGVLSAKHVQKMVVLLAISDREAKRCAPTPLRDPMHEVRSWALSLLRERMLSELLAESSDLMADLWQKLLPCLTTDDSEVSNSARKLVTAKLSKGVLAMHFGMIVPRLLTDPKLQSWSFDLLRGKMSADHLVEHVDVVISHLTSQDEPARKRTFEFIEEQMPGVLSAKHVQKIVDLLNTSGFEATKWALTLLTQRMPSELLADHLQKIAPFLHDDRLASVAAVLFVKKGSSLSRAQLAEHSERLAVLLLKSCSAKLEDTLRKIVGILRPGQHHSETAKLLSKLPVSCIIEVCREQVSEWRDEFGNTWLHLAARAGHLEACQALVDMAGLALHAQNRAGEEPLALAATRELDRFLRSKMHFQQTRFGHGNAYDEMENDKRPITEVVWYTVPLPGMAGHLGGLHSFLVITVSGGEANQAATKRYVLEKAGSAGREAHQKHGVFVGNQDLGANLTGVPGLRTHKKLRLANTSKLKEGLQMEQLHEEAHGTGPYDLASSNCHHAAQRVFNRCCTREEDREASPPNQWLAKLAAPLGLGGLFNSTCSTSEGSGSEVASSESEVASSGCRLVEQPSDFTSPVDLHSDAFAKNAAALSCAVYEEDAASVLTPTDGGAVVIHNKLGRAVVVYEPAAGSKRRVETDARIIIGMQEEKVTVDVYAVAWVPGLYPHRRLAQNQPVWRGHAYDLTMDFRNNVELQEVVQPAQLDEVDVLHVTRKANSKSPVQWLLARSGTALYLCFRGTDDVQDAAIDLSAVPDCFRFKEHGLGVHGGIAHVLEQEGENVDHVVKEVFKVLNQHRRSGDQLVLCGHSLGGGYAQVMAVHLLSLNVDVSAVRTFGAPHVLVPQAGTAQTMWHKLHAITQHWVHDWDPVPRLPLCQTWLVDVLPRLKKEVVKGVRVGIAQKYIENLQRNCNASSAQMLNQYDVVGQVVLVSMASGSAHVASEGAAPLKELLSEKPPEAAMTLSQIPAYHSMPDYLDLARRLTK